MANHDDVDLFDPADVVCFGAAHPVVAVAPDGSPAYWLLIPHHHRDGSGCCQVVFPDHEHTGPLPEAVAAGLGRCNAPTGHGSPCRNRPGPGGRCHHHREVR